MTSNSLMHGLSISLAMPWIALTTTALTISQKAALQKRNTLSDLQKKELDNTFLLATIKSNNITELKKLLMDGADINAKYTAPSSDDKTDWENFTVLMVATQYRDLETVRFLVENGADVNAQDKNGVSALAKAVALKFPDIVQFFVDNSANINSSNSLGFTPLMSAAYIGNAEIVRILLKAGADINQRNTDGNTAIMIAVMEKFDLATIKLLFNHPKIDLSIQNKHGQTVYAWLKYRKGAMGNKTYYAIQAILNDVY